MLKTKIINLYGWQIEVDSNWIISPVDAWLGKWYRLIEVENFKLRYLASLERLYIKNYISLETIKKVRTNLKVSTPIRKVFKLVLSRYIVNRLVKISER